MTVLRWDKPRKIMSRTERESISADGAPPGVYVPNMSEQDQKTFRAKKIRGKDPRIEVRVTMGSQILIVVRPDKVRISMNGPAELNQAEWMRLVQAVWEAKDILWEDQKEKEKQNA